MNKLLKKVDQIPIVKMLQIAAVLIFVMAIFEMAVNFIPVFSDPYGSQRNSFWGSVMISSMQIGRALFQPLVLLALAEIIKIIRGTDAQNK